MEGPEHQEKTTMMEPGTAGVAGVVGAIARELQVTLVQLCGSGAYGQVWLVVDDSGWRRALKVVNLAGNAQEVNREVRGVREVCHRMNSEHRLPIIYTYGWYSAERGCRQGGCADESSPGQGGGLEPRSHFWYLMQLADDAGGAQGYQADTLALRLKRDGVMDSWELKPIIEEVLACVEALHRHDLVHRDIKPGNVLFLNGRATLGDIGLVEDASEVSLAGTPNYVPNELIRHGRQEPIDGRMQDLFAVGCLIRDLLGVYRTQRRGQSYILPRGRVARRLNALMLKACSDDPAERYREVELFRRDFLRCYGWREGGHRMVSTHPMLVAFGVSGVSALVMVGLGGAVLWQRSEPVAAASSVAVSASPNEASGGGDWYAELSRTRLVRDYVFVDALPQGMKVTMTPAAGGIGYCDQGRLCLVRGSKSVSSCVMTVELERAPSSFEMVWLASGTFRQVRETASVLSGGEVSGAVTLHLADGSFRSSPPGTAEVPASDGGFVGIHRLVCVNGSLIVSVDGMPIATQRLSRLPRDGWSGLRLSFEVEGAGEIQLSSMRLFEFVE